MARINALSSHTEVQDESSFDPDEFTTETSVVPIVAIVGRPNVGKSTLFNRIIGERRAIVAEEAGTTRDRIVSRVEEENTSFLLVDTAGLTFDSNQTMTQKMFAQVSIAMDDADIVVLVTDVTTGLHPIDSAIADLLRRSNKEVLLVVNKCDNQNRQLNSLEFYQMNLGDPIATSAIRNEGIQQLLNSIIRLLPFRKSIEPTDSLKIAIVGRPNVGKSSLVNQVTGQDRSIVDNIPGTTRDSVDTPILYRDKPLVLIDTAGLRRRGHITPGIEKFSALRAFQSIERCDLAILVLDCQEMVTSQDAHIAGYVLDSYKGLVIAINKWDLLRNTASQRQEATKEISQRIHWAPFVPTTFISARTGRGIKGLLETCLSVHKELGKEIKSSEFNYVLSEATARHAPPAQGHRPMRVYRGSQTGTHPPTFTIYVNNPSLMHFSYRRYLLNTIRSAFGFNQSLPRLFFKRGTGASKR